MERDFCWVIHVSGPDKRTKRVIKIENGLYPNYSADTNVLDILLVSLKADIVFSNTIKKARIGKPGEDCVLCNPRFKNDCVNKDLHAYGWGRYALGTVYNVLCITLNIPLNVKQNLVICSIILFLSCMISRRSIIRCTKNSYFQMCIQKEFVFDVPTD